jgi:type III secretion system FlhB-like substrate exporter
VEPATNGHGEGPTEGRALGSERRSREHATVDDELIERLREVDIGNTTPVEALNTLAELKRRVEERE